MTLKLFGLSLIEDSRARGHYLAVAEQMGFEYKRRETNRIFAGVAGGLADTLGVNDAYVRAAFLTLLTVWGLGGFLYLGFWLAAFDRVEDRAVKPVAVRQGMGLGLAFAGAMLAFGFAGWWPNTAVVIVAATLSFGTAALADNSRPAPLASLFDPNVERPGRLRLVLGTSFLVGGLTILSVRAGALFDFSTVLLAIGLTAVGVAVAFGPWVRRLLGDLAAERNERVRQEERAEMAAHLHDSVLQTLALIQRTDDPGRMAILARHQESELRDWLYGSTPLDGVDLVSTALKGAAAKVEQDHQIPVDVVAVGDHTLNDDARALVGAASEAMVNAAKHSGADKMSLYFERDGEEMRVYVTDQGDGFDPDAVESDRRGITDSIIGRVEKAGGSVGILSGPGEGTEVLLAMPVGTE